MNKETIKTLLTKANFNTQVAEILYPSMKKRYIDRNEKRAACFLATCAVESKFTKLVENMNYKKVNRATKLTEEIVTKVILDIINGDNNGLIAEKYGISRQSITDINYRRTWRHVKIDGYESVSVYKMSRKSRHS